MWRRAHATAFDHFRDLFFVRLSKAHTWAAAVLVDELDADQLQGTPDGQVVSSRHGRLAVG